MKRRVTDLAGLAVGGESDARTSDSPGRTWFATLLHSLEQKVDQRGDSLRVDRRNRRTWRALILGVVVMRATRLLALGRMVAPQRRAGRVKAAAQGVAYFLTQARAPLDVVSGQVLEKAVRQSDPRRVAQYTGKALVGLDPTEYEKRSRGRGKCGRQMDYSGRVRRSKATRPAKTRKKRSASLSSGDQRGGARATDTATRTATTSGDVDIWAGLALRGKQFFPLARQLFSSQHPDGTSQKAVEEAVLAQALGLLCRVGRGAIVSGDRGVGRTEMISRLAKQEQDAVRRVDPNITVYPANRPEGDGLLLADALADALVVLAVDDRTLRRFRAHAITLLKQLSVVGDGLTVGTLAEAISLDYQRHQRAWTAAWLH